MKLSSPNGFFSEVSHDNFCPISFNYKGLKEATLVSQFIQLDH